MKALGRDYILCAVLFVGAVMASLTAFVIIALTYNSLPFSVPSFFYPKSSGLSKGVSYSIALAGIVCMSVYIGILAILQYRKKLRFAIPWIIAGVCELIILTASVIDMRVGEWPYVIRAYAEGWLQLFVITPIVAGFIYFSQKSKTINKKHR